MKKLALIAAGGLFATVSLAGTALADPQGTTGQPGNGNQGCAAFGTILKNPGAVFVRTLKGASGDQHNFGQALNPPQIAENNGFDTVGAIIGARCGDPD